MQLPFAWGERTYVMGIVNCSPDSFSGDGAPSPAAAIALARRHVEEGADIVDVGGESTRPGAALVDADEELARVMPVIEALARELATPISIDTTKAAVARAALDAGASMVNDVWALQADPAMPVTVAASGAAVVLMHNRQANPVVGELGGYYPSVDDRTTGAALVDAIGAWLEARVAAAEAAGIARERIIVDPGIGFGKTVRQNLELLHHLGRLKQRPGLAGLPLLLGSSRKSVIGLTLGLPPPERLEGTLATLALGIAQGADLVRVHDVRAAVRCCRMADAIVRLRDEP